MYEGFGGGRDVAAFRWIISNTMNVDLNESGRKYATKGESVISGRSDRPTNGQRESAIYGGWSRKYRTYHVLMTYL